MAFKTPIIEIQSKGSISDLKSLAANNPTEFVKKTQELTESGKIGLRQAGNLRGLYESLSPVNIPISLEKREITSNAFQVLTSNFVVKEIMNGYEAIPDDTADLVTPISDPNKTTIIANVFAYDKDIDEVRETENFPEIYVGDEYVQIGQKRNGRKVSITKQAIAENRIADIVARCNAVGQFTQRAITKLTWRRVTDCFGSADSATAPYVYKPNGTNTPLYSASENTPGVRTPLGNRLTGNPLVDSGSLERAYDLLATFVEQNGDPIPLEISNCMLVVPFNLQFKLFNIINSNFIDEKQTINNWGPAGQYRPIPKVSRWLNTLNTTAWYLGDFKRQFYRKTKEELSIPTLGGDTQAALDADIVFQARASLDVEVGAVDYCYVVQNLAGTTFTVA